MKLLSEVVEVALRNVARKQGVYAELTRDIVIGGLKRVMEEQEREILERIRSQGEGVERAMMALQSFRNLLDDVDYRKLLEGVIVTAYITGKEDGIKVRVGK